MRKGRTLTVDRFVAEPLENRRLLSAGDLDTTFGVAGRVSLANFAVSADAVQSDGKILLAGTVLERLNANGTPDESFGSHGAVDLGFSTTAMILQPDGKILLSGREGVLARYTSSGAPDTGFGSGGRVQIRVPGESYLSSVALAPDGRIVQGGGGTWQDPAHPGDPAYSAQVFFASRYNPNGSVDTTFNGVGYVYREAPGGGALAVAVAPDGKVLVGSSFKGALALWRYTAAGASDRTFGLDGMTTVNPVYSSSYGDFSSASVSHLLVEADGQIIAGGPWHYDVYDRQVYQSFNRDGSLPPSVDSAAPSTSPASASPPSAAVGESASPTRGLYDPTCLIVRPDGTSVTGGWTYNYSQLSFNLNWTLQDGSAASTTAIDSLVKEYSRASGYSNDLGYAAGTLAPDGDLVLAFNVKVEQYNAPFTYDTLVVRLQGGTSSQVQAPFSGSPYSLDRAIEAENFDHGGDGVSFHDSTPQNIPGKYRNTSVDIAAVPNASNGYVVGYTAPGEWLEYSVYASYAGTFKLEASVANYMPGGTFHAEIDGTDVTGAMSVPNTGPWDTWTTLTSRAFGMSQGNHVLRISMDTGGYWGNIGDFDSFKVTPAGRWPYGGFLPYVSGSAILPAENFDNGGEGISYHDTTPQNITGKYRSTGVDIVNFNSAENYYAVGYTAAGEWLDYSINVVQPGTYRLTSSVASRGGGGTFHGEVDGQHVIQTLQVPDTGAWDAWRLITTDQTFNLTSGQHVLRIALDSLGPTGAVGNFDYFRFDIVAAPAAAVQSTSQAQLSATGTGQPGILDTAFGFQGRQLYNDPDPVALPNSLQRRVTGVAVQPDGKILLAGSVGTVADQGLGQISLRRLNPDGTRDAAFGTDGEVLTSVGPVSFATCILLQPDGKILLGGGTEDSATATTTASFALERFTANGSLDPTFATGGRLVTDFPGNEKIDSIALTPTGKIVAVGSYFLSPNIGFDLARYNSDGSPDTTLNSTGKVSYSLGQPVGITYPTGLAVQTDGKILVGSQLGPSAAVFRYSTTGILDSSFANAGTLVLNAQAANALAVQSDGKILVATVGGIYGHSYGLSRFTPSGAPDTYFGTNGSANVYNYVDAHPFPRRPVGGLILQPDGKIIVVGTIKNPLNWDALVLNDGTAPLVRRYLSSGLPDPTFEQDQDPGYLPVSPSAGPVAAGAALAPDGNLIVASNIWASFDTALHWTGVTRYQNKSNTPGPDPYLGVTHLATQPVQAEDFDTGGEGISFHDTTAANLGGKYRNTAVDVNGMGSNGFCVGYTAAGEWLDYTIYIPADGRYQFQARVACAQAGGTFHATISNWFYSVDTATLNVPDTGGWANFQTIGSQLMDLAAGTYVMRITLDTAGPLTAVGNFDYFMFVSP